MELEEDPQQKIFDYYSKYSSNKQKRGLGLGSVQWSCSKQTTDDARGGKGDDQTREEGVDSEDSRRNKEKCVEKNRGWDDGQENEKKKELDRRKRSRSKSKSRKEFQRRSRTRSRSWSRDRRRRSRSGDHDRGRDREYSRRRSRSRVDEKNCCDERGQDTSRRSRDYDASIRSEWTRHRSASYERRTSNNRGRERTDYVSHHNNGRQYSKSDVARRLARRHRRSNSRSRSWTPSRRRDRREEGAKKNVGCSKERRDTDGPSLSAAERLKVKIKASLSKVSKDDDAIKGELQRHGATKTSASSATWERDDMAQARNFYTEDEYAALGHNSGVAKEMEDRAAAMAAIEDENTISLERAVKQKKREQTLMRAKEESRAQKYDASHHNAIFAPYGSSTTAPPASTDT